MQRQKQHSTLSSTSTSTSAVNMRGHLAAMLYPTRQSCPSQDQDQDQVEHLVTTMEGPRGLLLGPSVGCTEGGDGAGPVGGAVGTDGGIGPTEGAENTVPASVSRPWQFTPRGILMYPASPQVLPQEFLMIQYSPAVRSVPYPTICTAWFTATNEHPVRTPVL